MNRCIFAGILIAYALCMFNDEAHGDEPVTLSHYLMQYQGGLPLGVHGEVLTRRDIERWAQLLTISDAQKQFLELRYGNFVDRHNEVFGQEAERFLTIGVELGDVWREEGSNSPAIPEIVNRMERAAHRFRMHLTQAEHELLDSLEEVLAPEQIEMLPILRLESTRRHCRNFRSAVRWVNVKLRDVWIGSAKQLASPEEIDQVQAILWDYEHVLTPLVCRRGTIIYSTTRRLAQNRIARDRGEITSDQRASRYRRIMRSRLDASTPIRRLAERTVDDILAALSPEPAAAFKGAAKQAAFPEVYPDQYSLFALFESLGGDDALDSETVEALRAYREAYSLDYKRSLESLERACIEWGNGREAGLDGFEQLSDMLDPVMEEHVAMSRRWVRTLEELVGETVMQQHDQAIPRRLQNDADASEGGS